MITRLATTEDSSTIARLSNQLGYQSSEDAIERRLHLLIEDSNHVVFVALKETQIAGWVHGFYTMRVETDPFVEIGGLVVDENHRHSGIGKLLVEEVIKWSASFSPSTIRVRCNTVRKESHLFYERLGFILKKQQKIFSKNL